MRILSGVFEGRTTGTPIGLLVENTDARSRDYDRLKDRFRPGHADYTYQQKYGLRDHRGGGRSSARETVMRVAAGAIARKYLAERLRRAHLRLRQPDRRPACSSRCEPAAAYRQSVLLPRPGAHAASSSSCCGSCAAPAIRSARASPSRRRRAAGLGEPVFDKLDADIAHAMMGINAVKAVEIGDGVAVARAARQRASRRADARGLPVQSLPAACWAAFPRASRSSCT